MKNCKIQISILYSHYYIHNFFVSYLHNWKTNPNHHSYQDRKIFSKLLTFHLSNFSMKQKLSKNRQITELLKENRIDVSQRFSKVEQK